MDNRFFEDLGETLSKTAKEFGERAESFCDKQRVRGQIAMEEHEAEKVLAEIGKVIFDRFTKEGLEEEDLAELCEKVKMHRDKTDALKEELAGLEGKKVCPACKKMMNREAAFCPNCGNPYPEEAEETETENL